MEKDLLAILSEGSRKFSKGQRIIAKYILSNYDKAAFMTAGRLGKIVGVNQQLSVLPRSSVMTVIRVCVRLCKR